MCVCKYVLCVCIYVYIYVYMTKNIFIWRAGFPDYLLSCHGVSRWYLSRGAISIVLAAGNFLKCI